MLFLALAYPIVSGVVAVSSFRLWRGENKSAALTLVGGSLVLTVVFLFSAFALEGSGGMALWNLAIAAAAFMLVGPFLAGVLGIIWAASPLIGMVVTGGLVIGLPFLIAVNM